MYIYRPPQCLSPRRNWDFPTPLSHQRVCPFPQNRRGEHTCQGVRGWAVPVPTTGEKRRTLPTPPPLSAPAPPPTSKIDRMLSLNLSLEVLFLSELKVAILPVLAVMGEEGGKSILEQRPYQEFDSFNFSHFPANMYYPQPFICYFST
jgi:hypothetical protein